jgi:hypothetical protein
MQRLLIFVLLERTHRDVKANAYEAANLLKLKNPKTAVTILGRATQETITAKPDGRFA